MNNQIECNLLARMGACQPAIDFLSHQKSWASAWEDKSCASKDQELHFEWRFWLLRKLAGDTKEEWNNFDHRKLCGFLADLFLTSQNSVDKNHQEILHLVTEYSEGSPLLIYKKRPAPMTPGKKATPQDIAEYNVVKSEHDEYMKLYDEYVKKRVAGTEPLAQASVKATSKAVYMIAQYATGGMSDAPYASAYAAFCDIFAEYNRFQDHTAFFAHANRLALKHYPSIDLDRVKEEIVY